MLLTCEVEHCTNCVEHTTGVDNVSVGICSLHKKEARRLSREYSRKLFDARLDVIDKFLDAITNIKEEKE